MPQRSPAHAALGRSIRRSRGRRGISQEELASLSGLHRTYVGGIERGERNRATPTSCGSRKRWGSGPRSCWPRPSATRLSRRLSRRRGGLAGAFDADEGDQHALEQVGGQLRQPCRLASQHVGVDDLVDASDDGVRGDVRCAQPARPPARSRHHEGAEAIHRGRTTGEGLRSRGQHLDNADVRQRRAAARAGRRTPPAQPTFSITSHRDRRPPRRPSAPGSTTWS